MKAVSMVCSRLFVLVALILIAGRAAHADAENLFNNLPKDTIYCVSVKNMSELRKSWDSSRYAEAWNSEEFAKFRDLIQNEWKEWSGTFEEKTHVKPDELFDKIDGFAAVLSTHLAYKSSGAFAQSEYDVCFLAEVNADKQEELKDSLDKLLVAVPDDAEKSIEEYKGQKIHHIKYTKVLTADGLPMDVQGLDLSQEVTTEIAYAFTDNYFLIAEGPNNPVKKLMNSLMDEDAARISSNPSLKSLTQETGGLGDMTAWVNLPALFEVWGTVEDEKEGYTTAEKMGLTTMGPVLTSVNLNNKGLFIQGAAEMPRERKGLISMMYAGQKNSVKAAENVPVDAYSFYSWTMDLPVLWTELQTLVNSIQPQAGGMINMWLESTKAQYGIDLENDLIANVQGEHAAYTRQMVNTAPASDENGPAIPRPSKAFFLHLNNGTQTVTALEGVFEKLKGEPFQMPLESSAQKGVNIWTLSDAAGIPADQIPAWSVTNNYILMSNNMQEMQQMVRQVTGEGGNTLDSNPDFKKAVASSSSDDLRLFNFNSREAYKDVVDQIRYMLQMMAEFDEEEMKISADDVPPMTWWTRYFGTSHNAIYLKPSAAVFTYVWNSAE